MSGLTVAILAGALAAAQQPPADPFAQLRDAYARRDAASAAAAYSSDAVVIYRYARRPAERYVTRPVIEESFRRILAGNADTSRLDLNFRMITRNRERASGYYRLRVARRGASYGRFDVRFAPDGSFAEDISSSATREDFEEAAGAVALAPDDEDLDATYYDRFTGRYRLPDGCDLIVTRSVVRLMLRNSCTQEWRGLSRVAGRLWTAGDRVISSVARDTIRFTPAGSNADALLLRSSGRTTRALRRDRYSRRDVVFKSTDGTALAGVLYLPHGMPARRAAVVMIHGSGAQDRNGYASIIAVMADELAANGRVVLAYDKRGAGGSAGDGSRAPFETLADDASAAAAYLATLPEVDRTRVGFAGSSQAGWVAAKAIERGAKPADVFLLGAAGAALTVAEQNVYNTEVRMRCGGLAADAITLGLDQQRAFFAFLRDPAAASRLDALTLRAAAVPSLRDWVFPNSTSVDRSAGEWYVTLDPAFDPLPVWRAYRGRAMFVFSEFDDATPTSVAIDRLRGTSVATTVLAGGQHLGLRAPSLCQSAIGDTRAFTAELFGALRTFADPRRQ
jgi:alpha/beta superfamily hydrolase